MGCGGTSYDDALAILQEAAEFARKELRIDDLPLHTTCGQISADDVYSTRYLPPFDNSAMDGFAVSSKDTLSASEESPVRLSILGSIAAGDTPPSYTGSGERKCYRINTGAPFPVPSTSHLPSRFDACARIEIVHFLDAHTIELREPVRSNQHRRSAGEDFQPGMILLQKGQRISPEDIAVIASNGVSHLKIIQQPRIAILTTGKELRNLEDQDASPEISGGEIFNSNGYYLRAALQQWGYSKVTLLEPVGDDPRIFQDRTREEVLEDYDVLVTTGGVSKGEHDYVKSSLKQLGAKIQFHGIRIRPGHPVLFATLPKSTTGSSSSNPPQLSIFSLPGNPVAAAACLRFLAVPFLRQLAGAEREKPLLRARLRIPNAKGRHMPSAASCHGSVTNGSSVAEKGPTSFLLAQYSMSSDPSSAELVVDLLPKGSGMLRPLAAANCWAFVREDQAQEDGELVDCWPLRPS